MKNFPYKTTFSAQIKTVPTKDKYLSQASLEQLRAFLPKDVDLDKNFDLLPIAGNAYVANKINANSDSVDTKTAIELADTLTLKFLDVEHDRKKLIGVIASAGFSEFGTDKPLTRDEVKDYTKPFNVTIAGYIWRVVNEDFADFIEETNDPFSENYLAASFSWEVMFANYKLILTDASRNLENGEYVTDESKIKELEGLLVTNGGSGKTSDGKIIGRVIEGTALPPGIGIVKNPAGQVKGIAVEKSNESDASTKKENQQKPDIESTEASTSQENNKKSEEKISQIKNENVKEHRIMKITKLSDINDEMLKEVKASAIHEFVESELRNAIKDHEAKEKEAKDALAKEEDARKTLAAEQSKLTEKLQKLGEQLETMIKEKEARAKEEAFSARMQTLDTKFNLSDEDRKIIASQIKDLSDEAWAAYEKNADVLFREKVKKAPETPKTEDKQETKASAETVVDEALKNADKEKAGLPNTSTANEPTLREKYAKHFGWDGFEISTNKRK